jgi:hypothetical protein
MSPSDQPKESGVTVKVGLFATWLFTVTEKAPDDAPEGTRTSMIESVQPKGTILVPFIETVLLPCVVPKLAPVICTTVPAGPEVGEIAVIVGDWAAADPHQKNNKAIALIGISFQFFVLTLASPISRTKPLH